MDLTVEEEYVPTIVVITEIATRLQALVSAIKNSGEETARRKDALVTVQATGSVSMAHVSVTLDSEAKIVLLELVSWIADRMENAQMDSVNVCLDSSVLPVTERNALITVITEDFVTMENASA